jgi:hypothetical protein
MKGVLAEIDADVRDAGLIDSDHDYFLRMLQCRAGGTSVATRGRPERSSPQPRRGEPKAKA